MKIEILKHPTDEDWMLCKRITLVTVGREAVKPPTLEWKKKILEARHSPIRTLEFCFLLTDIPYYVSVHLCRHVHLVPFVKSQRNDRQSDYDRTKAPQDAPVNMAIWINAEELMTVANKRLCMQADPTTRLLVQMICDEATKVNPEFSSLLVPNCAYHGGVCHEMNPCGLYQYYNNQIHERNVLCSECDNMTVDDGGFMICDLAGMCDFDNAFEPKSSRSRPCFKERQ